MFRRMTNLKWKQFEAFVFAGLSYTWVASLLDVTGRVQTYGLTEVFSNRELFLSQLGFLIFTLIILFYMHRLLKVHTVQNLLIAFFAAVFFALWEPAYVIIAMLALSSVYMPRKIKGYQVPRWVQPVTSLILITFIYMDGLARVASGLAPTAGIALRLVSLAILIELTVVYTWRNGTGKGPEIIG